MSVGYKLYTSVHEMADIWYKNCFLSYHAEFVKEVPDLQMPHVAPIILPNVLNIIQHPEVIHVYNIIVTERHCLIHIYACKCTVRHIYPVVLVKSSNYQQLMTSKHPCSYEIWCFSSYSTTLDVIVWKILPSNS